MPTLSALLPRLRHGESLLVTDTLVSPGTFVPIYYVHGLISRLIAEALLASNLSSSRPKSARRVIYIGTEGEGEVHFREILRRAGVHVGHPALKDEMAWCYIDAASILLAEGANDSEVGGTGGDGLPPQAFKALIRFVSQQLVRRTADDQEEDKAPSRLNSTSEPDNLIVLDSLSALSWLHPFTDSFGSSLRASGPRQFHRALQSLLFRSEDSSSALITLVHSTAGAEDELLFRALLPTCSYMVRVNDLKSGISRDCHGQITVLRSGAASMLPHDGLEETPPEQTMLYRIAPDGIAVPNSADTSATGRSSIKEWRGIEVWNRGMGRGLL